MTSITDLDMRKVGDAWAEGWASLSDLERESVLAQVDAHGGVFWRASILEDGTLEICMGPAVVVRAPLDRFAKRRRVQA